MLRLKRIQLWINSRAFDNRCLPRGFTQDLSLEVLLARMRVEIMFAKMVSFYGLLNLSLYFNCFCQIKKSSRFLYLTETVKVHELGPVGSTLRYEVMRLFTGCKTAMVGTW